MGSQQAKRVSFMSLTNFYYEKYKEFKSLKYLILQLF